MKDDAPIFGLRREKEPFEEYIGKYVIIYPSSGSGTFAGKVIKIIDNLATLNPHQGGICDKERGILRKMIYKNSKVNLEHINCIEPTTKEHLENYCNLCNLMNKDKGQNHPQ
jgi:hypothetical protein